MKKPIELRSLRDFGQVINDSFTFFKDNFKPLFTILLIICGFFILIGTVSSIFTYLKMIGVYSGGYHIYNQPGYSVSYIINVIVNLFIIMLTQAFIHLVTLCYISVYLQKNNTTPTLTEVWDYFKYYFLRMLGSGILILVSLSIGFVLCLLPGIYLMPIFYLIIPIIVVENSTFGYAYTKSFRLIKGNWWLVFGVIFIMSLIISMASSFVSIPITVITLGSKFLTLRSFTLPVIIIFSALRNVLMLAYALPTIAVTLCYFSLSEQKDGIGLLNRIDKFGKSDISDPSLPGEQY